MSNIYKIFWKGKTQNWDDPPAEILFDQKKKIKYTRR